ncbi:strawberry notch-like NTP hydrolase domain-containing protein [Sphingomonas sp. LR55]|uniref:strawberry notch family protein n=1 Tax=Sphingomonas sp. LR55 TaxID=3050231 RepID=UPI003FA750EC
MFAEPLPTGESVGVYLPYRPSRIAIGCASAHPTALVESIAMGSITAPRPTYVPTLPHAVVDAKTLSDAQLETLIYAGDAFERDIPGLFKPVEEGLSIAPSEDGRPYRTGFFLGDGTGAGKGRQVAAIILDQWLRGRRKHIWVSKTETLLEDARRDWTAVGGLALDIQHLNQWKLGTPIAAVEGVLFLTYATLRFNRGDKGTRLQQIFEWVGDDYDGMIVFDEAHEMAGVAGGEGSFGTKQGSDQGIAGVRLQNLLPRARVLYVSATGASDVNNLAYATRLGLWGPGTAFADRRTFVDSLRRGGIAALELIARDLKMQGLYVSRALSFAGVEYDILEHKLTVDQIEVYDAYADAWAIIHSNLRAALDATRVTDSFSNDTYNSGAKAAALSIFESTKQRFFCQLLIGMKLPSLVPAIRADLARGESVVIQLVSTSEAMLNRALAALSVEERANLDIELSPREFLMSYLTAAFPVRQMKTFVDETGKTRSEPMSDEDGRPVFSQEALKMRDNLLEQLCALPIVGSALDHIIGHFGTDAVAEVTGRSRRVIMDAHGRQRVESRSPRTNLAETEPRKNLDGGNHGHRRRHRVRRHHRRRSRQLAHDRQRIRPFRLRRRGAQAPSPPRASAVKAAERASSPPRPGYASTAALLDRRLLPPSTHRLGAEFKFRRYLFRRRAISSTPSGQAAVPRTPSSAAGRAGASPIPGHRFATPNRR